MMMDISSILTSTMKDKQCSSLCAFLLLEAGERDGIYICQSESIKQTDGRLRDKGDKPCNESRLGNNLHRYNDSGIYDARYAIF